jgi:hypothetical protein
MTFELQTTTYKKRKEINQRAMLLRKHRGASCDMLMMDDGGTESASI